MKSLLRNSCLIILGIVFLTGCGTISEMQKGAMLGTGAGAGAGAIIGGIAGSTAIGTGAGAAAGLVIGALTGSQSDKKAIQNVKVYVNNKEIGGFNVNDNLGYDQVAMIIAENSGVAVVSGPLYNIVREKLLNYGLKNSQVIISSKGNYNNIININL